jgi:hypothetical protein
MTIPRPDLARQLHEATYAYDAQVQMLMVHSLGATVIRAAEEEQQVTFEALMALSDDEYAAWRTTMHDDAPPPLTAESNSDKVMLMHSELTRRSQLLFGIIGGYSLAWAAAGSLQLHATPSATINIHHELTAESTDGRELLVRKSSRLGNQAHRRQLAVSRRDFSVIAQAVLRLESVTARLPEGDESGD